MKYHALGQTGLYISELTLGTMTFAQVGSASAALLGGTGQRLADRMVAMAIERGVNLFDTANIYGMGESEIILGRALGARRNEVVIATKFYHTFGSGPNDLGGGRMAVMRELDASLRRLGTDCIDLYQLHNIDPTTPLDETLRALDDVVRQGKVRYIGLSNFPAWQIARADAIGRALGTTRFCSAQIYYSLVGREVEREILPAARELGLGTMIWGPLAAGFLTGKYGHDGSGEGRRAKMSAPPVSARGHDVVDVLRQVAEAHQASMAQVALAWLRHQPGVTTTIVGATKEEQLRSNLESVDLALGAEELTRLDAVSALAPEYPQWMVPMRRGETMASRMAALRDGG
jgi:aryl-alcohol dehydrogenase-like predicted oxidoreductase